jgi:hypothetical protein
MNVCLLTTFIENYKRVAQMTFVLCFVYITKHYYSLS